ncbi:MAG TPA: ABC transporter ATP-binding protein, partial [Flavisolibacter sp.]|nr:ABC transporter ATP-binding protein [Flavisolibacter sp.]
EKVCTHVAIIKKGVLKTVGTVAEILSTTTGSIVAIEIAAEDLLQLQQVIKGMNGVKQVFPHDSYLQLICSEDISAKEVNQYCFANGVTLDKLNVKRKSLETTFLELTGTVSER